MSSGDGSDNYEKASPETKVVSPRESAADGCDENYTLIAKTKTAVHSLDSSARGVSEVSVGSPKENIVSSMVDGKSEVFNITQIGIEEKSEQTISKIADAGINSGEDSIEVPAKPTFLVAGSTSLIEDFDSENQDEEFVLKWDDYDEEETLSIKNKESSEKFRQNVDNDDSKKESVNTNKIDNIPNVTTSEIMELKTDPKPFEDDLLDDDQEDLLSEIDAQIAELGASLSKAENEKFMNNEKCNEGTILTKATNNSVSNNPIGKQHTVENIIVLDITEETADQNTNNVSKNMQSTLIENQETQKITTDTADMEIEKALLANIDSPVTCDNLEAMKNNCNKQQTFEKLVKNKEPVIESFEDIQEQGLFVKKSGREPEIKKDDLNLVNLGAIPCDYNKDKDLLKAEDIQTNITTLEDLKDIEMETSHKDDSFVHSEIPTQELLDLNESETSLSDTFLNMNQIGCSNISVQSKDDKIEKHELSEKSFQEPETVSTKEHENIVVTEQPDNIVKEKQTDEIILKDTVLEISNLDGKSSLLTLPENQDKKDAVTVNNTTIHTVETCPSTLTLSLLTYDDVISDINTQNEHLPTDVENQVSSQIIFENRASDSAQKDDKIVDNVTPKSENVPQVGATKLNTEIATEAQITLPAVSVATECKDSDADTKYEDMSSTKEPFSSNVSKGATDVQPSTSQLELQPQEDTSDDAADVAEVTDSLGLLAESSRVRDEDDGDADGDDQETSDHDDYDDDFDPDDESSNQQQADNSEDSTQNSESNISHTQQELASEGTVSTDNDKHFGLIEKETEADTAIEGDTSEPAGKEIEDNNEFDINDVNNDAKDGDGEMDIDDEIVCEEDEVALDNIEDNVDAEEADVSAPKHNVEVTQPTVNEADMSSKQYTDGKLRELLENTDESKSPSKKKLEISQPKNIVNIVDLESSSEDEASTKPASGKPCELTSVNISSEIEVMSSGDNISDIVSKEGETVITVPKASAHTRITSRLNTSEITIKTASTTEPTLVIPEAKIGATPPPSKFGALEVFNLDSDEEDACAPPVRAPTPAAPPPKPPGKCVNSACTSDASVPQYPADSATAAYYENRKKKRATVCENCLLKQVNRAQRLVEGIRDFTPLLSLEEARCSQDLVEISDSDSDDEGASEGDATEKIDIQTAGMLERQLADMINETWEKFKLDVRLKEAQDELTAEMDKIEKESAEVDRMLDQCQAATDKLRTELYATFEVRRHQLPGFVIHDTPDRYYMCPENSASQQLPESNKRRLSSASESQAKKVAIPVQQAPEEKLNIKIDKELANTTIDNSKVDDDKDISVVTLSAEAAPADLPPPGEAVRPPLQTGQTVFAMRHAFGSWITANVLEVTPKGTTGISQNFTMCRVKFENKTSRNAYKLVPARCLAYYEPSKVRMTIGTRVIALFKDTSTDKSGKRESFYSGVVSEVPNPVNKYRYLVFFDDGYAQYVQHCDTRLVCECSALVWEEVHPFSREFVREYLLAYPERPMVRLHTGQSLKTEWNGKWWLSRVLEVDASLVHVHFEQDKRTEWIYRGSTRLAPLYLELQAAERQRARPLPRNRQNKLNMPYVEYTRYDERQDARATAEAQIKAQQEEIRRQRAVAKKSTTPLNLPPAVAPNLDAVTSRVVYYTPKNAVKPYKMTSHTCGPKCKRSDVLALKELRTYNPLAKPLLSGWERQIVRFKGHKKVMYRAPCGRRLRHMEELHRYLRAVNSDMGVDLFDFGPNTHCLAEFVLNKCIVGKKDLSHGKENVPVPCVNYYDDSLPEFCSYNTERTPTAGVPLNLDPEFLCGCDCTDDCQDKSKCACWKMTLEGARTIGMDASRVGYVYKRLPEPLPSGIYECNSRCKCKMTCLNRVAQHPLQLKLQVFKTLNRGWGIRALNDVPKGSFLCIYAGNLLTDATANLDGLNEGDEYLAELDYIEVVEQMKEGFEDDIPEQDKKLDRKELGNAAESDSEETESEEESTNTKSDVEDGDFEPGYIPSLIGGFNKRLRKREKKKQQEKENKQKEGKEGEDDCITISDDEELREPSRFAAQAGMGGEFISKYRSVRTLFGRDEACYIMDAKVQGNIGRYLNHSCSPNVFVQNVFVDTHDPRFPWVAFFALAHIRAGTELTWNYNYDVGSVPDKALYCYCGAPNCRGRLL